MHPFRTVRPSVVRRGIAAPLLAVLTALGACIDGVEGPAIDETGSVTMALSQPTATVAVGMTAVSAITLTRIDGYQGTVLLSADSLPTGVTASFDPAALGGAATTSIMTLTADATAAAKLDTINVRASGTNLTTVTQTVVVTIAKGAFTLTSPTTAVAIPQGGSGSIPMTIARSNGFATGVNFVAEGLPANVTATFTPALLPNGAVSSTLLLAASTAATPGTINVTVRARGQGVADKTFQFALTIGSSAAVDYALSASPSAFSIVAGTTAQSVISISRSGGYAGSVTFALSGAPTALPTGITAAFAPNGTAGNSSTLTVNVASSVAPGTYSGAITATAVGAPVRSLPVIITVTPVPGVKVEVAPTTLRIAPGGFTQAAVLLTRVANFTGDFTMTAENLPAGVTASFAPAPVTGTATTLSLAATATTAPGTYNIVVKATAGSDFGTFTVPLTVGIAALRQ